MCVCVCERERERERERRKKIMLFFAAHPNVRHAVACEPFANVPASASACL